MKKASIFSDIFFNFGSVESIAFNKQLPTVPPTICSSQSPQSSSLGPWFLTLTVRGNRHPKCILPGHVPGGPQSAYRQR